MPTLTPGQTRDRYVIVKFIANGGMGEVYHARHKVMGSDVALKLVFRHLVPEPAIVERFLREVQAVARLNHGHIVRVYDAGEAGGEYFMAMEYLPGGSLAAELRELHEARQQMPIPKAVEITRQIALALDYAHRVGFSHRDVKPGNILKRSATEYVLTGFGIVLDEAAARLTNTGWGMGTPTYVPPEQWNGNAVPQSDIYALGITLYEMLVGDVPLRATAPSALMNKHMTEQPSRVLVSRPDVPSGLQHVLDIALAKKSEDRFQTGADFAVALAQVMPPSSALPRPVTIEKAFAFMANPTPPRLVDPSPISPKRVGPAEATIGSNVPPAQRSMSRRTVISLMGGAGALGLGCKVSGTLFKQPPPAMLTPASTATPFAIPTLSRATFALAQGVNIDFVRVPAGVFLMGSDGIVSGPRHFVTLPEYWNGRAHVTVAQFTAFVTATNYRTQAEVVGKSLALIGAGWDEVVGADWAHPKGPATDTKGKEDHPVVHVSWDDAIAFSVWAAKKMGTAIRLPSEAEWEKAARGADGRKYPWGEAAPTSALANFNNAIGANTPVGKYSPAGDSPYGCVDMVGNAWQWVNSLHKPYPYSATDGRESATDRGARTLRGSGFNNTIELVYAALRVGYGPSNHDELTGFRVCASSV